MKIWAHATKLIQLDIERFQQAYITNISYHDDDRTINLCVICKKEFLPGSTCICVKHRDMPGKGFMHPECADDTTLTIVAIDEFNNIKSEMIIKEQISNIDLIKDQLGVSHD